MGLITKLSNVKHPVVRILPTAYDVRLVSTISSSADRGPSSLITAGRCTRPCVTAVPGKAWVK
jgi:hypothetical protein